MGAPVFGNEFFDQWLHQKSSDILAKVEREKISNEDMLILSLKAQVNHFHHMDIEFREEFRKIDHRFEKLDKRLDKAYQQIDLLEQKFDKRFDRLTTLLTWGFGLFVSSQIALWLK